MEKNVHIVGAGLAGSEAALQLAQRGISVVLHEMRPAVQTAVHKTGLCAELVCSNSLKSTKTDSAAGMLQQALEQLGRICWRLRCGMPCRRAAHLRSTASDSPKT